MGYLEVEDKRTRDYIKDEIVNTIMQYSMREKENDGRVYSLDEQQNYSMYEKMGQLSTTVDGDNQLSFYEATSDNILDAIESKELIEAVSYLEDSEIDLLTRLYVKQEDEYEIALALKTTVENVRFNKIKILNKIKNTCKLVNWIGVWYLWICI